MCLTVNFKLGLLTVQGSSGIAIDTRGNVALFGTAGAGQSVGGLASGGVNISASTDQTIHGLSGVFTNQSVGAGAGPSVGGQTFQDIDGDRILGIAVGAGASNTITDTVVTPLTGRGTSAAATAASGGRDASESGSSVGPTGGEIKGSAATAKPPK